MLLFPKKQEQQVHKTPDWLCRWWDKRTMSYSLLSSSPFGKKVGLFSSEMNKFGTCSLREDIKLLEISFFLFNTMLKGHHCGKSFKWGYFCTKDVKCL